MGISVDFFSSGYLDVSVRRVRFLIPILFRMGYSLRSGFPHSDISGSKLHCQLPRAFRRLARPSSPVIAKASTTCTYSLDPITLCSLPRTPATGNSFVRHPVAETGCRCNHNRIVSICLSALTIQPSSILLKSADNSQNEGYDLNRMLGSTHCRGTAQTAGHFRDQVLVEDDGIEPTTPCLQSRCSPS